MEMRFAGVNVKSDLDGRIQTTNSLRGKIFSGAKSKTIVPFREIAASRQQLRAAAVAIGLGGCEFQPVSRYVCTIEADWYGDGGFAECGIQNVSRNPIHTPSHFSKRR